MHTFFSWSRDTHLELRRHGHSLSTTYQQQTLSVFYLLTCFLSFSSCDKYTGSAHNTVGSKESGKQQEDEAEDAEDCSCGNGTNEVTTMRISTRNVLHIFFLWLDWWFLRYHCGWSANIISHECFGLPSNDQMIQPCSNIESECMWESLKIGGPQDNMMKHN